MVLVFLMIEKNNRYELLDENSANKIELIKALNDKSPGENEPQNNDNEVTEKMNKDENKLSFKKEK